MITVTLAQEIRDTADQYESDREAIEAFIREHAEVEAAQYAVDRLPRNTIKVQPDGYDEVRRVKVTSNGIQSSTTSTGSFRTLSNLPDSKLTDLAQYVRTGELGAAVLEAAEEMAATAREGAEPLRG